MTQPGPDFPYWSLFGLPHETKRSFTKLVKAWLLLKTEIEKAKGGKKQLLLLRFLYEINSANLVNDEVRVTQGGRYR